MDGKGTDICCISGRLEDFEYADDLALLSYFLTTYKRKLDVWKKWQLWLA